MRLQEFTASVDSNLYHWLGIVDKCLGNKYDWNKVKFDSDMLCKKLNQHLGYPITQRIVRDSGMDQFQAFLEEAYWFCKALIIIVFGFVELLVLV